MVQLVTDKGPFGLDLRRANLAIAIFFLVLLVIGAIFHSVYLGSATSIVGFVISLLGNLALLIGALRDNPWLVLVWLIQAVMFFIGWPIAVLGVIFNFGGYRHMFMFDNIILIIVECILTLIFYLFCTRLVYSYFQQLRNSQSNPQHAVVV